jgi:hypothetical protein
MKSNLEQRLLDAVEDQAEATDELRKGIAEMKVVVHVPKSEPPAVHIAPATVNVAAPSVQVDAPNVTVNHARGVWEIEAIRFEGNRITKWRLTPVGS